MPVIMIHSLELTESQKKTMAKEYTRIMSELTKVPEERIYCFFSGYPLDAISAGGVLNSEFPDSALKQFDIQYTQELMEKEAIRVASRMKVKPGKEAQAREALISLLTKTREESGCLGYDLFKSTYDVYNEIDDGSYFLLREKWVDLNAVNFHVSTDYFAAFMAKSEELFDGAIEVTKEIDSARHNDAMNPEGKVISILQMKAKPGKEEEIKYGLINVMRMASDRTACKMYDVFQGFEGIYDPSVFITFQIWDSKDDLDKALKYVLAHMPFSPDDLTEPRQLIVYEMTSNPV